MNTEMFVLPHRSAATLFPPVDQATPEGLLAIGGDLSSDRLLSAYRQGIFPWYSDGQPILWWSPDPRAVLYVGELKISRSLRKTLRRGEFSVTFDRGFTAVIGACAAPREQSPAGGTWITDDMMSAYVNLHQLGYAHSVEVRRQGRLVGGLYGIAMGKAFFGESMFSRVSDASKVALVALEELLRGWGYTFIDCQLSSPHILSLGAREIPRRRFLQELAAALRHPDRIGNWERMKDHG